MLDHAGADPVRGLLGMKPPPSKLMIFIALLAILAPGSRSQVEQ